MSASPLVMPRSTQPRRTLPLLVHLGLDLLAHGAAQQVRLAQRIAGEDLRDLHHLLLVDDDPERLLEHRLDLGMDVFGLRALVLAVAIDRDVGHRPRAVERDQRDDVLEAVRLHVDQRPAHAAAFQLEHAHGLGPAEHGVGLCVVKRDLQEVDGDAALCEELRRLVEHGKRLQAEEVELHEARLLDPFHVELGDRHVGLRVAVERHHLAEAAVADDDAGRVGGSVAVEAFELLRDGEHARHGLVLLRCLPQACLLGDRLLQRHRIGRVLRHELRQLVDLAVGHLQHAADVAHDAPRLQRAEGDDLRHALVAVAILHVADHALAAVLTEVDVEVRHRDAVGIEEPLEQQVEAQGVEVGDLQGIGDERTRARSAAGPTGMPCSLAQRMKSETIRK